MDGLGDAELFAADCNAQEFIWLCEEIAEVVHFQFSVGESVKEVQVNEKGVGVIQSL